MHGPVPLDEASYHDLKMEPIEVAVLPMGATEPHGMHLPYGTDVYQVDAIAREACRLARDTNAAVVSLPPIPFGVQTSQQTYPLAMNLYPSTLYKILDDLSESLVNSGVKKLLILNGHGGNDFYTWLKESYGKRDLYSLQVNWFQVAPELAAELFPAGGDHANDMETSMMLHLRPDLVAMERAGAQPTGVPRIEAMRAGWARAPRPWERYTVDSGAGDPRQATAAKGEQFFKAVTKDLARLIIELAEAKIDATFPF